MSCILCDYNCRTTVNSLEMRNKKEKNLHYFLKFLLTNKASKTDLSSTAYWPKHVILSLTEWNWAYITFTGFGSSWSESLTVLVSNFFEINTSPIRKIKKENRKMVGSVCFNSGSVRQACFRWVDGLCSEEENLIIHSWRSWRWRCWPFMLCLMMRRSRLWTLLLECGLTSSNMQSSMRMTYWTRSILELCNIKPRKPRCGNSFLLL